MVLFAICTLLGRERTWDGAKELMSDNLFFSKLLDYDKDNVSMRVIGYVRKNYTEHSHNSQYFDPESKKKSYKAAQHLVLWILSLIQYRTILANIQNSKQITRDKLQMQ